MQSSTPAAQELQVAHLEVGGIRVAVRREWVERSPELRRFVERRLLGQRDISRDSGVVGPNHLRGDRQRLLGQLLECGLKRDPNSKNRCYTLKDTSI